MINSSNSSLKRKLSVSFSLDNRDPDFPLQSTEASPSDIRSTSTEERPQKLQRLNNFFYDIYSAIIGTRNTSNTYTSKITTASQSSSRDSFSPVGSLANRTPGWFRASPVKTTYSQPTTPKPTFQRHISPTSTRTIPAQFNSRAFRNWPDRNQVPVAQLHKVRAASRVKKVQKTKTIHYTRGSTVNYSTIRGHHLVPAPSNKKFNISRSSLNSSEGEHQQKGKQTSSPERQFILRIMSQYLNANAEKRQRMKKGDDDSLQEFWALIDKAEKNTTKETALEAAFNELLITELNRSTDVDLKDVKVDKITDSDPHARVRRKQWEDPLSPVAIDDAKTFLSPPEEVIVPIDEFEKPEKTILPFIREPDSEEYNNEVPPDSDLRSDPNHEVIKGRNPITYGDILKIVGGNKRDWLNDNGINGFITLICDAAKAQLAAQREAKGQPLEDALIPRFHTFNTQWFPKMEATKAGSSSGYANVKMWAKRAKFPAASLLKLHKLFLPIHLTNHWALCIVAPPARSITVYDSMAASPVRARIFAAARTYLRNELGSAFDEPAWSDVDGASGQQSNGSDCGVFACWNALASLYGDPAVLVPSGHLAAARDMMALIVCKGGFKDEFSLENYYPGLNLEGSA